MRYSTILGIESSCDDTAAAIWKEGKILANVTAGQKVHELYGGVVPELASRAHQSNIIPVIEIALKEAHILPAEVDAVAYTQGPGLMGSLHVGGNVAKGLSMGWQVPLIGINHLQAHVAALFIDHEPQFPMLCLLVSGGHTQLLLVHDFTKMDIVGSTIDDAAGEAFDKAAKLLGLPYPGGPLIDKYAAEGNENRFGFPEGKVPGLDYSFSGIKTSLLYFLRKEAEQNADFVSENLMDICASYQKTIVQALLKKAQQAIEIHKPKCLGLAGGVSANSRLRTDFKTLAGQYNLEAFIPAFEYCTDNAAMIAVAGHYMLELGHSTGLDALPFSRSK